MPCAMPSGGRKRDGRLAATSRARAMKVSYFETGRYVSPPDLPREWPVPAGSYDPETGAEA